MRKSIFLALFSFCLVSVSLVAQVPADTIPLYISKQNGQHSFYAGSNSKTTDRYESGTVSISTSGPVQYEVDPNDLSISPNQTKTWYGMVWGDLAAGPAPGQSTAASITGNYNVKYSRPQGTGSGGTVLSTYNCGEGSGEGCEYHGHNGGVHEIVNKIGSEILRFIVFSVNVESVDSVATCPNTDKVLFAQGYPNGGTYTWTGGGNVAITAGANTTSPTIRCANTGNGTATVRYTVGGVSFSKTIQVRCVNPSIKLNVPDTLRVGINEKFSITPTLTPSGGGGVQWTVSNGLKLNSGPYNFVAFVEATAGGWQTITARATICGQVLTKTVAVYVNPCMIYAPDSIVVLVNTNTTLTASANVAGNFSWKSGGGVQIQGADNQASITIRGTVVGRNGWAEVNFKNTDCDLKKRVRVVVLQRPTVRIWASFGDLSSMCKGERRILNVEGLPAGGTYSWSLSTTSLTWLGAAPGANSLNPVIEAARGGACVITCTYTVNGQTATTTANVYVREYSRVVVTANPNATDVNNGAQVTYTATVYDHAGQVVNPPPSLHWKVVYIPIGREQNVGDWVSYDLQGNGATQTYTWSFPQGNFPLPNGGPPYRMRAWIEAAEYCTYRSGSVHINVIRNP